MVRRKVSSAALISLYEGGQDIDRIGARHFRVPSNFAY